MDESVLKKAEDEKALVKEVSEVVLAEPMPAGDIVPYEAADPGTSAEIEKRIGVFDFGLVALSTLDLDGERFDGGGNLA